MNSEHGPPNDPGPIVTIVLCIEYERALTIVNCGAKRAGRYRVVFGFPTKCFNKSRTFKIYFGPTSLFSFAILFCLFTPSFSGHLPLLVNSIFVFVATASPLSTGTVTVVQVGVYNTILTYDFMLTRLN